MCVSVCAVRVFSNLHLILFHQGSCLSMITCHFDCYYCGVKLALSATVLHLGIPL